MPHVTGAGTQNGDARLVVDSNTQPGKPSGHCNRRPLGERVMNNCGWLLFVAYVVVAKVKPVPLYCGWSSSPPPKSSPLRQVKELVDDG